MRSQASLCQPSRVSFRGTSLTQTDAWLTQTDVLFGSPSRAFGACRQELAHNM
jgi:hypothetical protein